MPFSKNTLLAVLLIALNNNASAFMSVTPRAASAVSQQSRQESCRFVSLSDIGGEVSAQDDGIPPEDYLVNVGDLESEDDEDGISDDGQPPSWYASAERIAALRLEHRRHEGDTGSPEYQIAGMTERINYLTSHLKVHPKDFSTRRGLVALVNKRRRLLNYLYKQNVDGYKAIVSALGIRHKVPGQVEDRNEKYSRFPGQKAARKHLINKKK